MKKTISIFIGALTFLTTCTNLKTDEVQMYHRFEHQAWYRFDILKFEVPIEKTEKPYDISFFASCSKYFEYEELDFNMIMTSPSGEERIKEYHLKIKDKSGKFPGEFVGDSCIFVVSLKKGLSISKKGILKIEIENLVPRMETRGLFGVGIRLKPRG
jgi:gliding motility-associated lipoprotein GldH